MARFRFDQFCFDSDQKALLRGGEPVRLTPRAFRLLELLILRRPKAISKRDLLDHVWSGNIVEEANLKTLVLEIRTALEERGGRPEVVRTVYGYGYAFVGQVEEEAADSGAESQAVVSVRWSTYTVLLPLGAHVIGRRPDCAVAIDDPSVSRVHARLEITRDMLRIEDLHSKNGTFVEGKRIKAPTELLNRCEIVIGEVNVKLARLDSGDASTQTAAPRLT
ncbi:MAG TPA: FHA domain-containing protein [Thermoanaerobaculia bacterium]|nr:FHA domain-containing protein [Thermoanaerobaculia bacterium]